jgi:hypothetical protein
VPFPISLKLIAETEAAMGVVFPIAMKFQMSRSNGGEVTLDGEPWWLYPFRDPTNRRTISRTGEDIRRETEYAIREIDGFPPDGIAIAHNGAGDRLFLRRDGSLMRDEVWIFRMHGAECHVVREQVDELWREEAPE